MIIESVLDVILNLLSALLGFLPALPSLPSNIVNVWSQVVDMMRQGMSLLGNWFYLPVALPCLGIVVAINLFEDAYNLIRWFVSKIPFLNIRM